MAVLCYDTNRPAFLERDLVGLGVNGIWQVWVQYSDGEAVSIHTVRKGTVGFSNVKALHTAPVSLEIRFMDLQSPWVVMG